MAGCIILAGGASTRMPGDKAFMEVAGRRVIDIQLEMLEGVFEQVLVIGNTERIDALRSYERAGVMVLEESARGMGPLGGVLSGLEFSGQGENFVLACDMPFVNRAAVEFILHRLKGYQACVPCTPKGLEPLHAAYLKECAPAIAGQLEAGELKVTRFFDSVRVNYIQWEELLRFDRTGRLLLNLNSPEDMREARDHWPNVK